MKDLLPSDGIDPILRGVIVLLVLMMILLLEVHHIVLGRDMVELEGQEAAKTIYLLGLLLDWSNEFITVLSLATES
jgi:hypothetical protein